MPNRVWTRYGGGDGHGVLVGEHGVIEVAK